MNASDEQATPDGVAPSALATDRIASLDFIRGIAVLGILAANIVAFGQPFMAYMYPASFLSGHDASADWMWVAQFLLVDGKMRTLFSLLFGAGMMLFMEKAWERGATRWLQARRLAILLGFGLFHFYFIWRGDILTYYALTGFLALLCLRWRAKTQLVTGLTLYLVGALIYAAMMVPLAFVADTPMGEQAEFAQMRVDLEAGKQESLADDVVELPLIEGGDYPGYVAHNLTTHRTEPLKNWFLFVLETFPLMLIGMALYRYGLFGDGLEQARQRKWGWAGVIAGGLATLAIALWAKAGDYTFYGTLAAFMGMSPLPRLAMAVGLAALLAQWAPRANGWLGQRLSAAGRAAFSNYLGTSIVMIAVFHGWGAGLFGELTRAQLYLVVLGAWALMLLWSKPWLERFRFGPLEWLWRCLTYGRLFAIRR